MGRLKLVSLIRGQFIGNSYVVEFMIFFYLGFLYRYFLPNCIVYIKNMPKFAASKFAFYIVKENN